MVLDTLLFTLAVYPYHINDAWCGFRCWMKTLILTRSHSHYTFNENSCIYLFQWEHFHPKNIILCIIYSSSHKCFKNLMGEWRVENLLIRTISIVIFSILSENALSIFWYIYRIHTKAWNLNGTMSKLSALFSRASHFLLSSAFVCLVVYRYVSFIYVLMWIFDWNRLKVRLPYQIYKHSNLAVKIRAYSGTAYN